MFKLMKWNILRKMYGIFFNWWQQHVSKRLGQGHVHHCISSSLKWQSVYVWELRRPVAGVGEEFCRFCVWYRILATQPSWVFFVIFFVSWSTKCFLLVKGLAAGRPVQQPDSSIIKPCCCNRCRMWFIIVFLKYTRPSLKKMLPGCKQIKPVYTFQHWWCLSRCASWPFHRH